MPSSLKYLMIETDSKEIKRLRELAGMTSLGQETSAHATALHQLERRRRIRPGSAEWFAMWCAKPFLTGEKGPGHDA